MSREIEDLMRKNANALQHLIQTSYEIFPFLGKEEGYFEREYILCFSYCNKGKNETRADD